MVNHTNMFRKIISKIFWIIFRVVATYRKCYFQSLVIVHGGKLDLGASIIFAHTVLYQGKGLVVLADYVQLGYSLAGSRTIPILLQPRETDAVIRIGAGTPIVNGSEIIARTAVYIGENCRIGARTSIVDSDFHEINPKMRHLPGKTEPVIVGDNVWIGNEVTILKGATIGDNAVIGVCCVVTKDVPRGTIVAGNPMQIIRSVYA